MSAGGTTVHGTPATPAWRVPAPPPGSSAGHVRQVTAVTVSTATTSAPISPATLELSARNAWNFCLDLVYVKKSCPS